MEKNIVSKSFAERFLQKTKIALFRLTINKFLQTKTLIIKKVEPLTIPVCKIAQRRHFNDRVLNVYIPDVLSWKLESKTSKTWPDPSPLHNMHVAACLGVMALGAICVCREDIGPEND